MLTAALTPSQLISLYLFIHMENFEGRHDSAFFSVFSLLIKEKKIPN